jgi:hypothetical protein
MPVIPRTGARYRHYKGGVYRLLHEATIEATLEPCMVYRAESDGHIWVRPLKEWNGTVHDEVNGVARRVRRFERVPE